MHDLTVPLDPSYPVRIRSGFAEAWTALRQDHGDRRLFVVADARVMRAHPDAVAGLSIEERGKVVQMKGGEQIKSLRTLDRLVAVALERRVDRRCLVVAIGGGTVGDVVGYFAASYMRGLDWCPIATTVIAMADSAIGGKTAVNSHGLKNLIGSFHQPIGVYGALDSLLTLPRRHRTAGLAEVVKCGIIADAELFALLEAKVGDLAPENLALWQELLSRSAAVKADVVSRDPKERGPREILNFGHTLGHALEASHRPRLHHGEAVALGMIAASQLSESRGLAPPGTSSRIMALLGSLGLPVSVPGLDVESALGVVGYDKKVWDRQVRMVLTEGMGSATVGHAVSWPELSQALLALRS